MLNESFCSYKSKYNFLHFAPLHSDLQNFGDLISSSLYSLTALDGSMAISALAKKIFFQCETAVGLAPDMSIICLLVQPSLASL
jgi:hypothetical protein